MRQVQRLTGVYHADGGVLGELRYVLGRLRGTAHCALCDITHAGVRRKSAWDGVVAGLGVPVDLVHLDERSPQVRDATGSRTPAVLAHVGGELVEVLAPDDLEAVGGDLERFDAALRAALASRGLSLPGGPAEAARA